MAVQFLYPEKNQIIPELYETSHYLGYTKVKVPDEKISNIIEECQNEMHKVLMPKAVFDIYDLKISSPGSECAAISENKAKSDKNITTSVAQSLSGTAQNKFHIQFADLDFYSLDLGRNLKNCKKIAIMACTIGPQVDALIRKTQAFDPVKASVMQATGAMYVEKVVDFANEAIKAEAAKIGLKTRPRYSAGYGDVPLDLQKDFFRLLPCTKIGLTLMSTLIMAPEKSVTAFVGMNEAMN